CFPHIVDLTCKAMLQSLSGLDPKKDIIKKLRGIIHSIRISSMKCYAFSLIQQEKKESLQLIRDVDTRWSSTYLMIERAFSIDKYLKEQDPTNQLTVDHWNKLSTIMEILKLPHAFQEVLSSEKTPTLCNTLPSFDGLLTTMLKRCQVDLSMDVYDIIQDGIDKLEEYQQETDSVPAYTLSVHK
ncbi:hypothetical protein BJV77DRAFT_939174, partial [Russula vinacea]